jgi:putative oxidoreductase
MRLIRRIARPLLASMFVTGGLDALKNPDPKVKPSEPIAVPVAAQLPGLPAHDPRMLVQINGAVMVGAGVLLGLGRFPRLAAAALAATLVPTTLAGHRFWEYDDPQQRANQQIHFFKNVSMLGGLLITALDTEGKPSLGWRAHHAVGHAESAVERAARQARREAKHVRRDARLTARAARAQIRV